MKLRFLLLSGLAAVLASGPSAAQSWEALPTAAPAPADNPATQARI